jgi:peptidoglycan/xylan/chitin deacetylase (PgdA/CDA1 family)
MINFKHKIKYFLSYFCPTRLGEGYSLILTYHSINPDHPFSVKPEEFEKQVKYLSERFDVVRLDEIDIKLLNKSKKEKLAITFDDGFEDNYTYAFPILKKYCVPATIFITSDFVFAGLDITEDWKVYNGLRPLNLAQIQEMQQSGISFGSHSKTHRLLSDLNINDLKIEIGESKKIIEQHLDCKISSFGYPFGQKKDLNRDSQSVLKGFGYSIACTNMWGVNNLGSGDCLNLRRMEINYLDSYEDFINKINGKWDFISIFQKIKSLL